MRAVICGGGIAGLAHALALGTRGWDVTVLEIAPAPREGGYMIDLLGPGWSAAEALGIMPRIKGLGRRYELLRYVDARGRETAHLGLDALIAGSGGKFLSVMRPEIERTLREHLPRSVELRYGMTITAIECRIGGATATLDDGTRIGADLVIGADGLHSRVRGIMLGEEEPFVRRLGYHVGAFRCWAPGLAERLGSTVLLTDVIHQQVGVFAVDAGDPARSPTGEVCAFIALTDDGPLPKDGAERVRAELAHHGSIGRALRDRVPDDCYYDLVAQSVVPVWGLGRVVLAGDAAHAVSLLAGQGAAMAMTGAVRLGEALDVHDVDEALVVYDRGLRPLIEQTQRAGRRAAGAFVPTSRARQLGRRAALATTRIPGVRRVILGRVVGRGTH